jgi:hypothetical protein
MILALGDAVLAYLDNTVGDGGDAAGNFQVGI